MYPKRPALFWVILALIALLGLFSGQYLFERITLPVLGNRRVRYVLLSLVISLILSLGYYSWRRFGEGWQHKVWLLFYTASLALLGIMGFIDQFIIPLDYATLVQLHHYRVFLLSSLPYIILYLLTLMFSSKNY